MLQTHEDMVFVVNKKEEPNPMNQYSWPTAENTLVKHTQTWLIL